MWGSVSKSDERYYRRKDAEDKARSDRRKRLDADMPRRLAILDRVKAGEITIAKGQSIIRKPNAESEALK